MELSQFGLNSYEERAYIALLKLGVSTAHAISQESGVPDGKIYPVLGSLEKKGFVKLYPGAPKRFLAADPKIALQATLIRQEKELKMLRETATGTIKVLEKMRLHTPDALEKVHIIEGYKAYLSLSAQLHDSAQKEWLSISRLPIYKPHIDSYKKCVKRGLDVRLLTCITENNKDNIALWKRTGASIRKMEYMQTRFSVIDEKEVVIRISGEKQYLALWIQNPSLAVSMRNYFMSLWKDAKAA